MLKQLGTNATLDDVIKYFHNMCQNNMNEAIPRQINIISNKDTCCI